MVSHHWFVVPQVTRQDVYAYIFRYNSQAFDDVAVPAFRQALSAELGTSVTGVYHPTESFAPLSASDKTPISNQ